MLLEAGADPRRGPAHHRPRSWPRRGRPPARAGRRPARRTRPDEDHPIHAAAAADDEAGVRALLDADPHLVHRGDRQGGTPLHRAVAASAREVVGLLLDRGADIHALHGAGPARRAATPPPASSPSTSRCGTAPSGASRGYRDGPALVSPRRRPRPGDRVPPWATSSACAPCSTRTEAGSREARPSGKRALSSAVEFGHEAIARLLLDRGADPNWPEGATAPRGAALHAAARARPPRAGRAAARARRRSQRHDRLVRQRDLRRAHA